MLTYEQYASFCLRLSERTGEPPEVQAKAILDTFPPPEALPYREICLATIIDQLEHERDTIQCESWAPTSGGSIEA